MNDRHQLLLNKLKNILGKDELFEELKQFFDEHFTEVSFEVIKLIQFPPFYLPVSESQNIESLIKEFSNCNETNHKDSFIIASSYYIYPLVQEGKFPNYLLVFDNQINKYFDEIKSLCHSINNIFKIVDNNYKSGFEESALQNANLISQMSHDINSMISVIKSNLSEIDNAVTNKINYSEKMTKHILQYVREVPVLESDVDIAELLSSVIQNVCIPERIQVIRYFDLNSETITIDVELIDRALGEIIKNSVSALGNESGIINVTATIMIFENIILHNRFLEITVEDSGEGINPDFLEFVKNPFFTTKKSEYHCGLGLSIADKIIEAHKGSLNIQINKENNSLATIYLPMQGKENE